MNMNMNTNMNTNMNIILVSGVCVIGILCTYQIVHTMYRRYKRKQHYKLAQDKALLTNKKLLVIGDPKNGLVNSFTGVDYGYGDECLDLTGCPDAPPNVVKYKGKLEDILPSIDLRERVLFISHVLEQVDEIDKVIDILKEMDKQDLFILTVSPYTLEGLWYPNFITGEPTMKRIVHYHNGQITYTKKK